MNNYRTFMRISTCIPRVLLFRGDEDALNSQI